MKEERWKKTIKSIMPYGTMVMGIGFTRSYELIALYLNPKGRTKQLRCNWAGKGNRELARLRKIVND